MATQIAGVNVGWGVSSALVAGTGFTTTGAKFKNEGKMKELADKDGVTKTVINYDPVQTLNLDVYLSGAALGTLPAKGDTVAVAGVSYMFIDGELVESNEGEQKVTMSLKKWPGITLT